MFRSFSVIAAIAALSLSSYAAEAAPAPQVQVQSPCRLPSGSFGVDACVVVTQTVVNRRASPASVILDTSVANQLKGRVKNFSVVYAYRSANRGGDTITVERGRNTMISDISANKPTYIWVITSDGGKRWSNLFTTNMDSVITY